jgi:ketosteroid isomerase-like protein
MSDQTNDVMLAADALVTAFREQNFPAYFGAFADTATFILHSHPETIASLASYRILWEAWRRAGFEILDCVSSDRHVQCANETAVFTHRVSTTARLQGETIDTVERETIVFARIDGRWLAIHEHLSPLACDNPATTDANPDPRPDWMSASRPACG